MASVDRRTEAVRRKYDRFAFFYDLMEAPMENAFNRWRPGLWARAHGRILEVGVGTGRNMAYYPADGTVIGVDFSSRMLARARRRQQQLGGQAEFQLMDIQHLAFPADTFDTVVSTCVFCTVPDPVRGLMEVRRVLKEDGRLLMLEHIRSANPRTGKIMDWLNPFVYGLIGTNINRDTVKNLHLAGFEMVEVRPLWRDILLEIETRK